MRALLLAPLLLTGCVAVPTLPPPDPTSPRFDAIAFFTGHSTGTATLKVAFRPAKPVHVTSDGRVAPDGTLILDQTIVEGAKPPRRRTWRIREVAPGRYAGTLTPDATGPVSGTATPGRLRLAYPMKDGLRVEQTLALAPDRRSTQNVLVVRALGLPVAVLEETIARHGG